MTDDLVSWLRTQLDEDEREARATLGSAGEGRWRWERGDSANGQAGLIFDANGAWVGSNTAEPEARFIVRHDPASVLADIAAKRAILDLLAITEERTMPTESWIVAKQVLRLLASAYSTRPGYREEWRP